MQRKILGNWKQYSGREFPAFFSGGFQQLPVLSGRIRPEIIRKNPENSRPENCFHVPGFSRVFLQHPVTFPHLSWKIRWQERSTWGLMVQKMKAN
jgi:hypothetical protein